MKIQKVPLSWVISKVVYDSSKFIKGSIFTFTTLYLIGTTYIILKGVDKNV